MNKQIFFIITLISLSAMCLWAAEATNFTGTWLLDESRLELNEGEPNMSASKIVIKQNKDSLATERFVTNPMMGDFTITEDLTLDGKECKSTTEFGDRISTAVWSEDKKVLTIKTTIFMNWDGQEMEMKSSQIWSLEKENTVLKIQATIPTPMGEREITAYYNKK